MKRKFLLKKLNELQGISANLSSSIAQETQLLRDARRDYTEVYGVYMSNCLEPREALDSAIAKTHYHRKKLTGYMHDLDAVKEEIAVVQKELKLFTFAYRVRSTFKLGQAK